MSMAGGAVADDGVRGEEGRPAGGDPPAVESGPEPEGPCARHSRCQRRVNDEDVLFVREGLARSAGGQPWSLYAVCDGHGGAMAANYVMGHLWRVLGPLLPASGLPHRQSPAFDHFASEVRTAVATAFVKIGQQFAIDVSADKSGTSVTLALLCGRLLTVANVGDADAVLDTGMEKILATVSDRIEANDAERVRLADAGVLVCRMSDTQKGPAAAGEEGQGPLRCWPGGLQVARSIGDIKSSSRVFSCPHIFQVCVPDAGTRLIMASACLWGRLHWEEAAQATRRCPVAGAARRLVAAAASNGPAPPAEDISALVLDMLPKKGGTFPRLVRNRAKAAGAGPRGRRPRLSAYLRRCLGARPSGDPPLGSEVLRTVAMVDGWELVRGCVGPGGPEGLACGAQGGSGRREALRYPSARWGSPEAAGDRKRAEKAKEAGVGNGEPELEPAMVRGNRRPGEVGALRTRPRGENEEDTGSGRRRSARFSKASAAGALSPAEPARPQAGEATAIGQAARAGKEGWPPWSAKPSREGTGGEISAGAARRISGVEDDWADRDATPRGVAAYAQNRPPIGPRGGGGQRKGSFSVRPAIDLEAVRKRVAAGDGVGSVMLALEDHPGGQPCWYFAPPGAGAGLEPLCVGWDGNSEEEVSLSAWGLRAQSQVRE
ncbi:unnamed protein product [Ostreobium quekettii]|uniref:protein-serine/threonine phosphatase n=1 Tax=Ostreobium quekettii TaxID=121088 RepID=A0A8S1IXB7_9CHLO|nr:unnamed protein product [Ostreobium quekettii]